MCGLFGAIRWDPSPAALAAMLGCVRHRGPDGWGLWASLESGCDAVHLAPDQPSAAPPAVVSPRWVEAAARPVVLGHTRLAIVDPGPASAQPFVADGPLVLVFNGEVYNHPELRRELVARGHRFVTRGDTEVLLAAYREWGTQCPEHLAGFFAFAVWDAPRRRLVLARDRLGQKPLYYHRRGDGLVFASELKALWAVGVTPRVDVGAATRYLALGLAPPAEGSYFSDVVQVPAASVLSWRPGGEPKITRYWSPPSPFDRRDRGAGEALRGALRRSVDLRFRADVPVLIALSGGVDSASILATTADLGRAGTVRSLSGAHARRPEERSQIERLLARFPVAEAEIVATDSDATYDDFLAFLRHHDEPLLSDGIFNQYRFMEAVSRRGVKVLLSGQGADELLLGYPWFVRAWAEWSLRRGRILRGVRWLAEDRRRCGVGRTALARDVATSLSPQRRERHKRRQALRWLRPERWQEDAGPAYCEELERSRHFPTYRRDQVFRTSLVELLKDEDRNSMAHGVETRLPFLDHQLVELALTFDASLLLRDGHTKHVLRSAFDGRLPTDVAFSKSKWGFYVPFAASWPEHAAHRGELMRRSPDVAEIVDVPRLTALGEAAQLDAALAWRVFHLAFAAENARRRAAEAPR